MRQSFQASQQGLKGVTARVARKIEQNPTVQTAKYGSALMYAQMLTKQTAIQKTQPNQKQEGEEASWK